MQGVEFSSAGCFSLTQPTHRSEDSADACLLECFCARENHTCFCQIPSHSLSSRRSYCIWGAGAGTGGEVGPFLPSVIDTNEPPSLPISTSWHTKTFLCSHEPQSSRPNQNTCRNSDFSVTLGAHRKFSGCCFKALTLQHSGEWGRSGTEAFKVPQCSGWTVRTNKFDLRLKKGNHAGLLQEIKLRSVLATNRCFSLDHLWLLNRQNDSIEILKSSFLCTRH